MKHRKHQKTPYQTLTDAIDSRMALDFSYADIAPHVRTDQQRAPAGAHTRPAAVPGTSFPRFPRLRPAVAVLAVAVLLLGGAVGAAGWMIAHFSEPPLPPVPPVEETDSCPPESSREEPTAPVGSGEAETETETEAETEPLFISEDDTLCWGGVVYIRTRFVVGENRLQDRLGTVQPAEDNPAGESPEEETKGCSVNDGQASASRIEEGTAFFRIAGYAEDRYVAVPAPDGEGYVLYMTADAALPEGLED